MTTLTKQTDIPSQLTDIYLNKEWWVTEEEKLPYETAYKYYDKLYKQGNILICEVTNEVVGYIEFWRINFEQFGRIICHASFCGDGEDILNGNIAYVANVWIDEKYRNSWVTKLLKIKFYENTHMCDYYCGMATRKKTQPVKVFRKDALKSKLFIEGLYV